MNKHLNKRANLCSGCPWNPDRDLPPLPADVIDTVAARIAGGEEWVCHQTCQGAAELPGSLACAGAPVAGTSKEDVLASLSTITPAPEALGALAGKA
jgi:hypothetical protein